MFDSFLRTECIHPFQSTLGGPKDIIFSKMAKTVNKVIPLFFHKKYCILRLIFLADETSATCLSNFKILDLFRLLPLEMLLRRVEIEKQDFRKY